MVAKKPVTKKSVSKSTRGEVGEECYNVRLGYVYNYRVRASTRSQAENNALLQFMADYPGVLYREMEYPRTLRISKCTKSR